MVVTEQKAHTKTRLDLQSSYRGNHSVQWQRCKESNCFRGATSLQLNWEKRKSLVSKLIQNHPMLKTTAGAGRQTLSSQPSLSPLTSPLPTMDWGIGKGAVSLFPPDFLLAQARQIFVSVTNLFSKWRIILQSSTERFWRPATNTKTKNMREKKLRVADIR